ncbi:MAG TPA: tRNA pseudouridine(54/55) synthase Pus10, partial [Planctomycetota bacterium]|nr:tRNA pseudouridine(54/55) synthase Pus10 [Planctomycetota bacterium]
SETAEPQAESPSESPSESQPPRERRGGGRGGPQGRPQRRPPSAKVFVEGRYRKLVRDLPQTVFFCPECKGHPRRRKGCARCEGYGKLTRDSVQELVGWVAGRAFGTRKHKFHGAGREDVDVRMLGRGRPFVLELVDPKVLDVDLAALEAEINRRNEGRLEIEGLHWTERTRVRYLKETPHAKLYRALVETSEPLDPAAAAALLGRRIEVVQKTPERVAHRRAELDRPRWIELQAFERAAGDETGRRFEVRLATQHGTYVKEALSGEGGRTTPSLAELLGARCTCLELDVVEILGAEEDPAAPRRGPPTFGAGLGE